jgi:dTDP-L-rhamnose 4-epimerase
MLGYKPKWSFDKGIEEFVKWVNTQDKQNDLYEESINELKSKGLYR